MPGTYDTIVIGAGPSGSAAASALAKGGQKVLLLEKEKLPRYKVCGGGLVWRARQELTTDISDIVEKEFFSIEWKMADGLEFSVTRDYPLITMVMRDSFDARLIDEAHQAGADIHDGESFEKVEFTLDSSRVTTSHGSYSARNIIVADGVLSAVHRFLNLEDRRTRIPAVEAEITLSSNDHELFEKVVFDITAIPGGYGWIFPKRNHLSIGVAAKPVRGISLNKTYRQYIDRLGIPKTNEKKYGFQIPLFPHRTLYYKNILFTGDAAGLADPLVAEGISHAIFSGKWAAQSILENEGTPTETYEKIIQTNLRPQLKSARLLSMIFYDYPLLSQLIMKQKGQYITDYVSDIFAGNRRYPDNLPMISRSIKKLFIKS